MEKTRLGFGEKDKEWGLVDLGENLGYLCGRRAEEGRVFRRRDIAVVCGKRDGGEW